METHFAQTTKGHLFLDRAEREGFFWLSAVLVPLLSWKQTVLSGMQNVGRQQQKGFLSSELRLCTRTGWTEVAQDPV